MKNRIIALILTITTLFSVFAITANAAREETFISEVALVYEDSVEDAREAIKGTDWHLLEYDLNPDADTAFDDGVYLIYKTSTNVEDAITDLRVMDMYGGYSTSNYEKQLEATKKEYEQAIEYLRITMREFKELYNNGDEMAKIAYRQMNYYKDSDTGKLMGDFFLGNPSEEELVTVMMEGNTIVVTNLISLLAVGISGGDDGTLAERITANYENKDASNNSIYYDVAKIFIEDFVELAAAVKRYDALADEYDLTDEDMSEEEYDFLLSYASVALALEEIPYGEGTLKDFILKDDLSVQDLCPIIAAFTEGQLALADIGVLNTVLQYNSPKSTSEIYKLLDETEKELKDENGNLRTIDVYLGVDRSIFEGNFAFTTDADRQQALTGYEWNLDAAGIKNKDNADLASDLKLAGALIATVPYVIGDVAVRAGLAAMVASKGTIATGSQKMAMQIAYFFSGGKALGKAGASAVCLSVGIGLMVAGFGLAGISLWYNYYNPDYTPIPNTMVDVRETDLGDKYVKYTVAKVYGDEEGRNADLNAYQGKEWNALYYTKDATAGNALLANFSYSNTSNAIARRYQGVAMFGEDKAFNLNSNVFNKNAPGVYLTLRYSTTKKVAASVPNVVGSMFAAGAIYTLVAIGGAGLGVGGTIFVQNLRKKKQEEAEVAAEA